MYFEIKIYKKLISICLYNIRYLYGQSLTFWKLFELKISYWILENDLYKIEIIKLKNV